MWVGSIASTPHRQKIFGAGLQLANQRLRLPASWESAVKLYIGTLQGQGSESWNATRDALSLRSAESTSEGLCATCYALKRQDEAYFGGHREEVLKRDGYRCRVIGCTTYREANGRLRSTTGNRGTTTRLR